MKSIFSAALLIAAGYAIQLAKEGDDHHGPAFSGWKSDDGECHMPFMEDFCAEHPCPDLWKSDDGECHMAVMEDFFAEHSFPDMSEGEHFGPPMKGDLAPPALAQMDGEKAKKAKKAKKAAKGEYTPDFSGC